MLVCVLGIASISILMVAIYTGKILRFFVNMIWNRFVCKPVEKNKKLHPNSSTDKHQVIDVTCGQGIDKNKMSREAATELSTLLELAKQHKMIPMSNDKGFLLYSWSSASKENFLKALIQIHGNNVKTVEVDFNDDRIDSKIINAINQKCFKKRLVFFGKFDIAKNLETLQRDVTLKCYNL